MLGFVLNNNYVEFNGKGKQQLLGRAIETKCVLPYICIFINRVEAGFLESQKHKPMFCFVILITSFLFRLMERNSYISSLKNLMKLNTIYT